MIGGETLTTAQIHALLFGLVLGVVILVLCCLIIRLTHLILHEDQLQQERINELISQSKKNEASINSAVKKLNERSIHDNV